MRSPAAVCAPLSNDASADIFDVRYWGAAQAAMSIKIREGGSIVLTIGERTCEAYNSSKHSLCSLHGPLGSAITRPRKGWSFIAPVLGATDALVRGLAIDLAPIRVNVVCPGLTDTEVSTSYQPMPLRLI